MPSTTRSGPVPTATGTGTGLTVGSLVFGSWTPPAVDRQFAFGNFDFACTQAPMSVCPLLGVEAIEPTCYSRNIELFGNLIFEPATLVIHLIALMMVGIMIYYIKIKYTAVGRKEMVMFFYMYGVVTILEFLLVSRIIPTGFTGYKYFAAAHVGMNVATMWCLLFNGFVGFQWAEDGTPKSLWSLRLSSLLVFAIGFVVAFFTFQSASGFSSTAPFPLYIVYFLLSAAFLITYTVTQVILVLRTLDDRWPLGDLACGVIFFLAGQVLEFSFSYYICDQSTHYLDGLTVGTLGNLLGVMMIYKYWDDSTKEDLEFAVGGKSNVWEVREPFLTDDDDR
ncbi:Chitin synthase, class 7 [Irineochytrium annulatum]|nr:Chitin synthase, class 7 [Irineochytrium annulatum]